MLSLFGALLGVITSIIPQVLKIYQNNKDQEHELALLDKQIEANKETGRQRLEEINIQADIEAEKKSVIIQPRPIYTNKFVEIVAGLMDVYNSSVRPNIAYAFFVLYAWVKYALYNASNKNIMLVWDQDDKAIFCTIIAYYFSYRTLKHFSGKK